MPKHVVILGAGTVGTSLAELLCAHQMNVCVVDASREALTRVEEKFDVQTVLGSACEVIPLFQAGVQSADLCLAVTSRDEVNLVGATIAKAMGVRRSVARVFNPAYRDFSTFDYQRHFQIDRLLNLESLTALEIAKAIRKPGLFAVENFARGGVQVQEVEVDASAKVVGIPLKDLKLPSRVRIGLIANASGAIIPGADDVIQAGDHVTLVGSRDAMAAVLKQFEQHAPPSLNLVIAGGGEVGFHLARAMQGDKYRIVLMEANIERCQQLAERLPKTSVLNADVTKRSEMEEARVGRADVFIAATGRDEDNIICGVEAKELGASRIVSVVRRPDYANVLEKLGIDVAISPRVVLAREVLGMLSGGAILGRSVVADGVAEIWEVEVQPDAPITAAPLKDLTLPQCLIVAIVRSEFVAVAGGDDQLRPGDTAVLLVQKGHEDATRFLFETIDT